MYFVHAFGVRVIILEHGALDVCKSPVCVLKSLDLYVRFNIRNLFYSSLCSSVAGGKSRLAPPHYSSTVVQTRFLLLS